MEDNLIAVGRDVGVSDLGEEKSRDVSQHATCQMCGRKGIRYVHQMSHPDHEGVLSVGRFCAAKMTDGYASISKKGITAAAGGGSDPIAISS